MKQENNNFDKVYNFLEETLDEHEKAEFLKELEYNNELKKELKLQKSLNRLLEDKHILPFYNTLKDVEQDIKTLKEKQKRINKFWYSAAAVLILLVSTVLITQHTKERNNVEDIFSQYYAFSPSGEITRGESDIMSNLSDGLIQYDLHNYDKAISILKDVISKDSLNIKAIFYISMSYIETGKYNLAIKNLESIEKYNKHILIDQIKWYLALCYVKTNNKEKAIKELSELANSRYYCKDKAKEILEKLKM